MPQDIESQPDHLSVSELNRYIKDVVNAGFPVPLWICGEIQGYERNKNKTHIFFELVEKDEVSKDIKARIGLVIFASRKFAIDNILKKSDDGFILRDDIEVKFQCRVDFYEPHGVVRLIVENIDPFYTLGKLAQEKQKLINLLREKGTLDKNKILELPLVPLNIGLITSDDSAAFNDFISELANSQFGFKVFLRNAVMQGKRCEKDVCRAMDELHKIEDIDVIVITRGGGSLAELSCFDSEMIVERIAQSSIPVLSGIGHEINITITDLAAHTYEKTPTAIAQFLVSRVKDFIDVLESEQDRLMDSVEAYLGDSKISLKNIAILFKDRTDRLLAEQRDFVTRSMEFFKSKPLNILRESLRIISNEDLVLKRAIQVRVQSEQSKIKSYERLVEMSHPVNVLKRGFSITRDMSGKVVKTGLGLKSGQVIKTELHKGQIISTIDDIQK